MKKFLAVIFITLALIGFLPHAIDSQSITDTLTTTTTQLIATDELAPNTNTAVDKQEACRMGMTHHHLLNLIAFLISILPIITTTAYKKTVRTICHTPTQLSQYKERLTRAPNARIISVII